MQELGQVDQAATPEVSQVDLDWQPKNEPKCAQELSGHQGRYATYRWAWDQAVDLTMDSIAQVIYECEMCCYQASQAQENQALKASVEWRVMAEI